MILVDDTWQDSSTYFFHQEFIDSVGHPYARDPGYVFHRDLPRMNLDSALTKRIKEAKQFIRE